MQEKSRGYVTSAVTGYATAMLLSAPIWDAFGAAGVLPDWWPPVSYVPLASGIAAGTAAVLLRLLTRRRDTPRSRGAALELAALGIMLLAWLLRGDAEVPTDIPLVGAELVGAALYAVARWQAR